MRDVIWTIRTEKGHESTVLFLESVEHWIMPVLEGLWTDQKP